MIKSTEMASIVNSLENGLCEIARDIEANGSEYQRECLANALKQLESLYCSLRD